MKITFLGTNGWFSTKTGNTICTLVESEKYYIIFDAGDGIQKLDKYVSRKKPIYLFLSHLHLDHIFGVHIMPKFKRKLKNKIILCLPNSLNDDLKKIAKHPFIFPLERVFPKFEKALLSEKENKLPFFMRTKRLNHIDPTWGYRMTIDGKNICYCCDTGKSENVSKLAKGADVLIHECSNPPGFRDKGWGHVNPQEAAQVAGEAGVKKLFLTHFSPVKYPTLETRHVAQKVAREIFKDSFSAKDDMVVKI